MLPKALVPYMYGRSYNLSRLSMVVDRRAAGAQEQRIWRIWLLLVRHVCLRKSNLRRVSRAFDAYAINYNNASTHFCLAPCISMGMRVNVFPTRSMSVLMV